MLELNDEDGVWSKRRSRFWRADWSKYSSAERTKLTEFFTTYRDHVVREIGCAALAAWGSATDLVAMLDDPVFIVRKSAAYQLCKVPQSHQIAEKLWTVLNSVNTQSTYAIETLESYTVHAPSEGLIDTLVALVSNDARESIRCSAARHLLKLEAKESLHSLLPMLQNTPDATWSLHIILIDACTEFHFDPPNLPELARIDNFDLQCALAEFLAERANRK